MHVTWKGPLPGIFQGTCPHTGLFKKHAQRHTTTTCSAILSNIYTKEKHNKIDPKITLKHKFSERHDKTRQDTTRLDKTQRPTWTVRLEPARLDTTRQDPTHTHESIPKKRDRRMFLSYGRGGGGVVFEKINKRRKKKRKTKKTQLKKKTKKTKKTRQKNNMKSKTKKKDHTKYKSKSY
jgi:hypothetical protein